MANLEIASQYVFLRVSPIDLATARGSSAQTIVCEESLSYSSTANINERKTKNCGTKTIPDAPSRTISISGIAAGDLGTNNVSVQQLMQWQDDGTLLYFVVRNDVSGTLGLGEVVYVEGQLRIGTVNFTSDINDNFVAFDAELAITGSVSYDIPA